MSFGSEESLPFAISLNYNKKQQYCDFCFQQRYRLHDCPDCHFMFYCNRNCEAADSIHKMECVAFTKLIKKQILSKCFQNELLRLYLRILIKIKFNNKEIMRDDLQKFDNLTDGYDSLLDDQERMNQIKFFKLSIKDLMGNEFMSKFTEEELISYYGKMILHKFEVKSNNNSIGIGLYLNKLNHSCEPNSVVFFDGPKLIIQPNRELRFGELPEISLCDVDMSDTERKKFLKQFYYFDCNCSRCSGIKKQQKVDIFPELKFNEDSIEESTLKLAIRIANMFLKTNHAKDTFLEFSIDPEYSQKRINGTQIIFREQPIWKKYLISWTERNYNADKIFINITFKKRLEILEAERETRIEEIQTITLFLAVLIIHELAHLLFRWKGFDFSPKKYKDAGAYLERKLFDGEVNILTRPKSEWTAYSDHYGLRIKTISSKKKSVNKISYNEYIKKVCNFEFGDDPNLYVTPPFDEEEIQDDTLALKECEETYETSGENDSELSSDNDDDDFFDNYADKCEFHS
ncbi:unnamed protein product [Brachionus calyciflorus]|uniref:MYND-type domain-containing protein n=1 Tax=Brachionus calyciflorus TaxID=104777 RepID=A0A813M1S4_9BILA|nr:unnamed protein product [Brachionus calyciflorus]